MKLPPPGPVYAIADLDALGESDLPAAAAEMVDAGVSWLQLRAKAASAAQLYSLLERVCRRLEGADYTLWLDDRADLAALFSGQVAGVHVGKRDLPPVAVDRALRMASQGERANERGSTSQGGSTSQDGARRTAIGASTHSPAQVDVALADPHVDALAVGPIFSTQSKRAADPVVGLDLVRYARRRLDEIRSTSGAAARPLIAIGGIDESNLLSVLDAGADTAAVISAVCGRPGETFVPGTIAARCRRLLAVVHP